MCVKKYLDKMRMSWKLRKFNLRCFPRPTLKTSIVLYSLVYLENMNFLVLFLVYLKLLTFLYSSVSTWKLSTFLKYINLPVLVLVHLEDVYIPVLVKVYLEDLNLPVLHCLSRSYQSSCLSSPTLKI